MTNALDRFMTCDPGVHVCWFSFFNNRLFCGLHVEDWPCPKMPRDWPLVVEKPRHYPRGPGGSGGHERPNDLIDLAFAVGAVAARAPSFMSVYPQGWKGQHTKEITMARVKRALSETEWSVLKREFERLAIPAGKQHNAYDAVGMGLSVLGRY